MNITPGEWKLCKFSKDKLRVISDYEHVAEVLPTETRGMVVTPEHREANARAIAQVPRMLKLFEAIEAYQKDGLNRWDWIQGEVNSVLKEIRGVKEQ